MLLKSVAYQYGRDAETKLSDAVKQAQAQGVGLVTILAVLLPLVARQLPMPDVLYRCAATAKLQAGCNKTVISPYRVLQTFAVTVTQLLFICNKPLSYVLTALQRL